MLPNLASQVKIKIKTQKIPSAVFLDNRTDDFIVHKNTCDICGDFFPATKAPRHQEKKEIIFSLCLRG
jgi:hypothetical protein